MQTLINNNVKMKLRDNLWTGSDPVEGEKNRTFCKKQGHFEKTRTFCKKQGFGGGGGGGQGHFAKNILKKEKKRTF